MQHTKRFASIGLVCVLLLAGTACAARAPRDRAQVAALGIGEAALSLDQVERDLYGAHLYDAEKHTELGAGVLKVLYAARAFERAAVAWPPGSLTPPDVVGVALNALYHALDDLEHLLPREAPVNDAMMHAIGAIRASLPVLRIG